MDFQIKQSDGLARRGTLTLAHGTTTGDKTTVYAETKGNNRILPPVVRL